MRIRWAVCAWLVGVTSCQAPAVFGCDDDSQCQADSARGTCELNGFCSFPDDQCGSGRRYSDLAGNGLSGLCVLEEETSTSSESDSASGTASTTTLGSTVTTTPTTTTTTGATTVDTTETSDATASTEASSSTTQSSEVPEDGLVLWISFDDRISKGGDLLDASGNEHHGSCQSTECPTRVVGPVGMAAEFDGVNDRIDIEDHPQLRFETGMSVSLWATNTSVTDVDIVFGKAFEGSDRNSYEMYTVEGPPAQVRWSMDADARLEGNVVTPTPFANRGAWVHLVGTWDGGTLVFYVDGVEVGVRPQVLTLYDTHPVTIGGDLIDFEPAHYWPGSVDEVRVYDRPLEPAEVALLFAQGQRPE